MRKENSVKLFPFTHCPSLFLRQPALCTAFQADPAAHPLSPLQEPFRAF